MAEAGGTTGSGSAWEGGTPGVGPAAGVGSGGRGQDAGSLAEQGQEAVEQIQEQAARLVDLAREQLTARLGAQKETAADGLTTLATVLRDAGRQVREQDQGQVAQYVDAAAGQVEQLAAALRTQDVDRLVATVGDYARRQPAAFLAAAFALGFAGTRFFRSTTSPRVGSDRVAAGSGSQGGWANRSASGASDYGYAMSGAYGSGYGTVGVGAAGYGAASMPAAGGLTTEGLAELEGFGAESGLGDVRTEVVDVDLGLADDLGVDVADPAAGIGGVAGASGPAGGGGRRRSSRGGTGTGGR